MKILYVEDNAINRIVVEELIGDLHEIISVETANEAFELAQKEKYRIILIDLNLNDPKIDGFGVLKELKTYTHLSDAIFIAHTNYFSDEWRDKCLSAGFDFYYPKPFELDTFLTLIKAA